MAAETNTSRWVIGSIVALAVVALLAWARNDPGIDDRDGDPEDVTEVVTDGETVPPQGNAITTDGIAAPPTT